MPSSSALSGGPGRAPRCRVPIGPLRVGSEARAQEARAAVQVVPRRAARRAGLADVPLVRRVTGCRLRARPPRAADRRLPQHHSRFVLHALGAVGRRPVAPRAATARVARAACRSRTRRLVVQRAASCATSAAGVRMCSRSCSTSVRSIAPPTPRSSAAARGTRTGRQRLVVRRPHRAEQGPTRRRQGVRRVSTVPRSPTRDCTSSAARRPTATRLRCGSTSAHSTSMARST